MSRLFVLLALVALVGCSTTPPPAPPVTSDAWESWTPEVDGDWPETVLPPEPTYDWPDGMTAEEWLGYVGPQYEEVPPWYHVLNGQYLMANDGVEWRQLARKATGEACEVWIDSQQREWKRTDETAENQSLCPVFIGAHRDVGIWSH